MSQILIIPGRGGSGEAHWQSDLEQVLPRTVRVREDDWDNPDLDGWAARIDAAARKTRRPPLAIAHSFGCLALAHAVLKLGTPLSGSFLVAPADPARFGFADSLLLHDLDHPSDFLASTNDPWLSFEKAVGMAEAWGSRFHVLGEVGHINVASGFGPWPEMRKWARLGCVARSSYGGGRWLDAESARVSA